jgi:hypothetical protein
MRRKLAPELIELGEQAFAVLAAPARHVRKLAGMAFALRCQLSASKHELSLNGRDAVHVEPHERH